jgi:hypothetical protein
VSPAARCAALILVVLAPAAASAADWVRVTAPDQHQHAYDRSKLFIDGDDITYWRRVAFRTPQPAKGGMARMAMYRERIDCRAHTHRTLGYLLYAQDGSIIDNVYTPEAPAEPVIPETVGDRYETLMCAFVDEAKSARARAAAETAATPTASASPDELQRELERTQARLRELQEQLRHSEPAPEPASSAAAR